MNATRPRDKPRGPVFTHARGGRGGERGKAVKVCGLRIVRPQASDNLPKLKHAQIRGRGIRQGQAEAGRRGDLVAHPALALALVEEKRIAKPDTA